MTRPRVTHESKFRRTLSKILVSGFVVLSFAAYVVHENAPGAEQVNNINLPASAQPILTAPQVVPTRSRVIRAVPTITATAPPPPTARPVVVAPTAQPINGSVYRDGSFIGSEADAYYGIIQVKATITNGKISDIEFLQYPNDRRTSQRINSVVMPWLQQEAIQTQDARVDIISGATLTSEAFIRSLQSALTSAKNGS